MGKNSCKFRNEFYTRKQDIILNNYFDLGHVKWFINKSNLSEIYSGFDGWKQEIPGLKNFDKSPIFSDFMRSVRFVYLNESAYYITWFIFYWWYLYLCEVLLSIFTWFIDHVLILNKWYIKVSLLDSPDQLSLVW